ncbi:bifunctional phosphopantothenoylcysteine decarboxylase/phosphopantothenate--cysteine ligase CoaBC [Methylobrevis albus]|uniref:Coenzyme A biosynthesis bifunctional protein CoaBC n=1 Tax=Methylobrevis albus TaxID=2793297 RepID=A0A931MZ73_9HYPH|nr:bifunctional phosphopantothenoylcysteine decarboxylase/phosphopantothenate--cysteine ligase CoaBC [Methylobrevis albus]MBH0237729.1 bifunctional phosphopantothenoylcysteine decarboxylase/phosphopantothenate--cysteine ligase CoaBC [Methylobrevis albus]
MMLQGKRILLIIGGGIAAYKVLELVRRLRERGASVRAVMTKSAHQFVTPLAVGALTESRVFTDLFDLTDENEIGHIRLSREADLLVVAPATADLIAKMAHGLCDDLASNCLLATDKPVLVAPAMNPRMWGHPATRRNVATLAADGIRFVGPNVGAMAERGETGAGRLAEPMEILAAIEGHFAATAPRPLAGRRAVVTSGPTHEPIDPVRYIANRSSGKQGHAVAAALAALGAEVTLVSGPVSLVDPAGVRVVRVETAREMLQATLAALPADIAVMAAAVADWRVADAADTKLKKDGSGAPPPLGLALNPDILATVGHHAALRPALVVGFAAETGAVEIYAREKLARKGADLIVANDVSPASGVFGGDANTVHLVTAEGTETWPTLPKAEVGTRLAAWIAARLASATDLAEDLAADPAGDPA